LISAHLLIFSSAVRSAVNRLETNLGGYLSNHLVRPFQRARWFSGDPNSGPPLFLGSENWKLKHALVDSNGRPIRDDAPDNKRPSTHALSLSDETDRPDRHRVLAHSKRFHSSIWAGRWKAIGRHWTFSDFYVRDFPTSDLSSLPMALAVERHLCMMSTIFLCTAG
jgi:hypothetical protein